MYSTYVGVSKIVNLFRLVPVLCKMGKSARTFDNENVVACQQLNTTFIVCVLTPLYLLLQYNHELHFPFLKTFDKKERNWSNLMLYHLY